jgi:hypothetical protein
MIFVGRLLHDPDADDVSRITSNLQHHLHALHEASATLLLVHPRMCNGGAQYIQKTLTTQFDRVANAWAVQIVERVLPDDNYQTARLLLIDPDLLNAGTGSTRESGNSLVSGTGES